MIKVNGKEVKMTHFPDGTCGLFDFDIKPNDADKTCSDLYYVIFWKYESDAEYIQLMYIVKHIREHLLYRDKNLSTIKIFLLCPYFPNARMDRTKSETEVFTLKYFASFINSLNFDAVVILDPHSDVTPALINNVHIQKPDSFIQKALDDAFENVDYPEEIYDKNEIILYFPDAGAMKRYKDTPCLKNNPMIYGLKKRNWKTGVIEGLEICNKDGIPIKYSDDVELLSHSVVLMIDDIISYGGTLAHSCDKLKEFGVSEIYAYATHVENSFFDKEKGTLIKKLEDNTLKCLYTTDSLLDITKNKENLNITQFNIF